MDRMGERKRRMPKKLRDEAERAKARHQKRRIAPDVAVRVGEDGWDIASPYQSADEMAWLALFLEAFGTRQEHVALTFIGHLVRLCSPVRDRERDVWVANEAEMRTAIAIVQSLAPRNEAEAALAAQAVALHFAAMKVGQRIAEASYPDTRTLAALANVTKAYAQQIETMQKLKGRKTTRQKITVSYEKHDHKHVHVHRDGGSEEFGGRVHEPRGVQAGEHEGRASLPRPNPRLSVVPVPSAEG